MTNTFGIKTHTLSSSFLANLFWYSFSPATEMELVVLPPVQPQPGEGRGAFAQRVQGLIAAELGIPVSSMNIQQKKRYAQQRQQQQQQQQSSSGGSGSSSAAK